MLYLVCPTCGELLANKQLKYMEQMKNVCEELGIEDEVISLGEVDNMEDYIKHRQKITQDLFKNICCRMRVLNYIELVKIIKG